MESSQDTSPESSKIIFHHFPQLPPEIRREIWRFTIPALPRLIPHAPHQELAKNDPARAIYFCIDRESRGVYLETYTANYDWLPDLPTCCGWKCDIDRISPFVNLKHDILSWQCDANHSFSRCNRYRLKSNIQRKLQHLAIEEAMLRRYIDDRFTGLLGGSAYSCDSDDDEPGEFEAKTVNETIYGFKGLETLTIVGMSDVYYGPHKYYTHGEHEKQRDLTDREMVIKWGEDQDEFKVWFAELVAQRPRWKAPSLRFMKIQPIGTKRDWEMTRDEIS